MSKKIEIKDQAYYERWYTRYLFKRMLIYKMNKLWLKVWWVLPSLMLILAIIAGSMQIKHDFNRLNNHANLDAPFLGIYSSWRTDGLPGEEPPKK